MFDFVYAPYGMQCRLCCFNVLRIHVCTGVRVYEVKESFLLAAPIKFKKKKSSLAYNYDCIGFPTNI